MHTINVTAQEYADMIGKSVTTARRRLEAMTITGQTLRRVCSDQVQLPRASADMRQPPPYTVIRYKMEVDTDQFQAWLKVRK